MAISAAATFAASHFGAPSLMCYFPSLLFSILPEIFVYFRLANGATPNRIARSWEGPITPTEPALWNENAMQTQAGQPILNPGADLYEVGAPA